MSRGLGDVYKRQLKEDGTVKQIRRAETPQDYFATLDYPGLKDEK